MKKTTRKLALHKTTIRNLNSSSLHRVRGGGDETPWEWTDPLPPWTHTVPIMTEKK
jgi:hypothetical protein